MRSTQSTPTTAIEPATAPITTADHGATNPQAAVIATRAAMTPFSIIDTSGLRSTSQAAPIPPSAPAAAATFVVNATYAKYPTVSPVTTPSVDPDSKPHQPDQ